MNLAEATMLTREQDGAHGLQGEAERTESFHPGEGTAQGDLSALFSYLLGGHKDRDRFFSG